MPEQYPVKKNPSTQVLSQFSKPYPDIQVDPVVLWEYGATKHICLSSIGCRFGRGGQCVYCNYGSTTEHSDEEKLRAVENILQTNIHKRVIVGSFGNYFDPEEVSWELFSSINGLLARTAIGSIIFETHYTTVSKKYLDEIKRVFSPTNKDIFIEMGLESSNPRILKEYINKSLDIRKFSDTIALIEKKSHYWCVLLHFWFFSSQQNIYTPRYLSFCAGGFGIGRGRIYLALRFIRQ